MTGNPQSDAPAESFDPFAGGDVEVTFVPTESQREIWTSAALGEDANCAFNESVSLELRGALDVAKLELALSNLCARHQALRTTFSDDGELALVLGALEVPVNHHDFSSDDETTSAGRIRELAQAQVGTPFDLVQGPLARFSLIKLRADRHVLILTLHHIVCDGWSILVLLEDLSRLYEEALGTGEPLPPAPAFSDYAHRLTTLDAAATEAHWIERYETLPPVLDLPPDRPRPLMRSFDSARVDRTLPKEKLEALKAAAAKNGVGLFGWMFAGWFTCLRRLTGLSDIVCGVPASGQNASGMQTLVGHCVNLLPVRQQTEDAGFSEFAREVQSNLYDALDHQEFTFGRLVRRLRVPRDPGRIPIVSVQFNLDPPLDLSALTFGGLEASFSSNPRTFENFEIFLNLAEHADGLAMECQYNTQLFDRATIEAWLDVYVRILDAVSGPNEWQLSDVPVLDEAAASVCSTLATVSDPPAGSEASPLELFAATVARVPHKAAVTSSGGTLSFAELDRASDRLAGALVAQGVRPDARVGLSARRDANLLVGILGIWKAGACYVPLDPEFPSSRLEFMVADAAMDCLVATHEIAEELPEVARTVFLDDPMAESTVDPSLGKGATRAYVIYTSGSTGKPKGVELPLEAISNFLQSMRVRPGLAETDVLVAVTTLSFDIAVLELLLPLVTGATVVIADYDQTRDPVALRALLESSEATVMQATPSTWQMLLDSGWKPPRTFKVLCGGEALPRKLASALTAVSDRVYNMYGPTETAIWSLVAQVTPGNAPVTIGTRIHGTSLCVVDSDMRLVPEGVMGELLIGGKGLALGYLNRPELTAERFVWWPSQSDENRQRVYRTGDLVRRGSDGTLQFVRRIDTQVKVRGFRVELGEIEQTLEAHPHVSSSVAKVYQPSDGDTRLVAYFVADDDTVDPDSLRQHLAARLPAYMVPQHIVRIDSVPLTPNLKVNRAALPDPVGGSQVEYAAPTTEAETLMARVWADVLGIEQVGTQDDFFALGGHSILATRVIARVKEQTGVDLPLRRLFANPVLGVLADHLGALLAIRDAAAQQADGDREEFSF